MGKNQHYVPQFLLRNFAIAGSDRLTALADLKQKVIRRKVSIRDQCSKNFIYSLDSKDNVVEEALQRLEGVTAATIRQILHSETPPSYATREWYHLLEFIVVQHSRTPSSGRAIERFVTDMVRGIAATPGVLRSDPPPTLEQLRKITVSHPKPELLALTHSLDMIPCLFDLQDLIVINLSGLEFVLPDVGVVLHNEWGRKVTTIGMSGYSSSGLQILLPLTPSILLVKFDPEIYRVPGDRAVMTSCQIDVAKVNRLLLAHAEQNVYFSGSVTTEKMLSRFERHRRTPRAEHVRSVRIQSDDQKRVAILGYEEVPDIALDVRWMRVRKYADSIPTSRRAGRRRESSVRHAQEMGIE